MKWQLVSNDKKLSYHFDTKHPKHRLVDYVYGQQCLNWECSGKLIIINKGRDGEFECSKCKMVSKLTPHP